MHWKMAGKRKTTTVVVLVDFHFPAIFQCMLDILNKEFDGQTNNENDNFTVTSHFHKKTVHLTINKLERTLKVSGPGQKLWCELYFDKRIALNLYKVLINDPLNVEKEDSWPKLPQTSTPTVAHAEPRFPNVMVSPVSSPSHVVQSQEQPQGMQRQITDLMDMIHFHSQQIGSLQTQLISLTTEVVKIKEQQVSKQKETVTSLNVTRHDTIHVQDNSDNTTLPPPESPSVSVV